MDSRPCRWCQVSTYLIFSIFFFFLFFRVKRAYFFLTLYTKQILRCTSTVFSFWPKYVFQLRPRNKKSKGQIFIGSMVLYKNDLSRCTKCRAVYRYFGHKNLWRIVEKDRWLLSNKWDGDGNETKQRRKWHSVGFIYGIWRVVIIQTYFVGTA